MSEYYLAVDIGASSGRHILGHLSGGKLVIEEIHRFENGVRREGGHLCWDIERLFAEICAGLKKCNALGMAPKSMGIDTWGVDYVLLDKNKNRIGRAYAYRDHRTECVEGELDAIIPPGELYERTGLQKQTFNTIYQLMALKKQEPESLDAAAHFLMLPDYFHFMLTGELTNEYTNASTTQLLDVRTKDWDRELMKKIGIDDGIFGPLLVPGTRMGRLSAQMAQAAGFSCEVILPATHDTGSAVMAVPAAGDNDLYISSGTWSLMGCELTAPITTQAGMRLNFTNEGGYDYRYRFLKNIMGLWMLQSVLKELPERLSYDEINKAAGEANIDTVLDCNDRRFLAPDSMIKEIQDCCAAQGYRVPNTPGEITAVIYNSLAACYEKTRSELSLLTGKTFDTLHIVGGGANNRYLNRLTASVTGMPVLAGPSEATAIGNIMAQMIAYKEFASLKEARQCVKESFEARLYV